MSVDVTEGSTLSVGELGTVLWAGRWIILLGLVLGATSGVLNAGFGRAILVSGATLRYVGPAEALSPDANWFEDVLVAAQVMAPGGVVRSSQYEAELRDDTGTVQFTTAPADRPLHAALPEALTLAASEVSTKLFTEIKRRKDVLRRVVSEYGFQQLSGLPDKAFAYEMAIEVWADQPDKMILLSISAPTEVSLQTNSVIVRHILVGLGIAVGLSVLAFLAGWIGKRPRRVE